MQISPNARRRFRLRARTVRIAVLGWTLAGPVSAQEPGGEGGMALDSIFIAHRTPLELADGRVSGPGFDRLIEAAAGAQFVMVGESHNLLDIPVFTGDLFEALHDRYGFQYLVLEDGPHAVELLVAPGVRGDRSATYEAANRYVNAFQFWTDQEIDLIARVAALSDAVGDPVWGVDNAWGVLHILEGLRPHAPDAEAGRIADDLIARARVTEAVRPEGENERFLTDVLERGDLDALREAFEGADIEARRLIDMLRTGFEIYSGRRSSESLYAANDTRERLMRRQFVTRYREAERAGDSLPRTVLKFGQWHAMAGTLNWGSIRPFGTFLAELAASNGKDFLSIWTSLINEPGRVWTLTDYPEYAAIARAGTTDRWWLVDLRPIRGPVAAGLVEGVTDDLRKVIFGFDFALLIGNGRRATRELLVEGGESTR